MIEWTGRRWAAAAAASVAFALAIAFSTALIPNPIFGRSIEPTWWSYPAALITAVLGGLVFATYVRDHPAAVPLQAAPVDSATRGSTIGGLLAYLAVGCPVCNKIVLLALGSTGAVQWFAPVQPVLAVGGVALLGWALRVRLRGAVACPVPQG